LGLIHPSAELLMTIGHAGHGRRVLLGRIGLPSVTYKGRCGQGMMWGISHLPPWQCQLDGRCDGRGRVERIVGMT